MLKDSEVGAISFHEGALVLEVGRRARSREGQASHGKGRGNQLQKHHIEYLDRTILMSTE